MRIKFLFLLYTACVFRKPLDMKKFIIRVLPVVFVIFVISISTIYAAGYNSGYITGDHPSQKGTLQLNAIGRNLIKISKKNLFFLFYTYLTAFLQKNL